MAAPGAKLRFLRCTRLWPSDNTATGQTLYAREVPHLVAESLLTHVMHNTELAGIMKDLVIDTS